MGNALRGTFYLLFLLWPFYGGSTLAQTLFFQPPTFSCTGKIVTADFNQDGKADLVCADGTVLLGKGDGTFTAGTSLAVTGNVIATADFNGDGKPDLLVVPSGTTTISILLGNGDGTFQAAVNTNVGAALVSVVVADLNKDGKPDVVGISGVGIFVLLGNGNGTFATGVTYPLLANSVNIAVVGDFNGDGKADIAVSAGSGTNAAGPVGVLRGNGDGTFQTAVISTGVSDPTAMAASDLNGDGKLDLLISDNKTFQTFTLLGSGNGTFQTLGTTIPTAGAFAVADLNGDSKPDVVISGNLFADVFLGQGDGTFAHKNAYFEGEVLGLESIVLADFNKDGKLDVAAANTILLGNGDGSLQGNPATPFYSNDSLIGAATGDFNKDGSTDIAVISSNPKAIDILLNDGTGKFSLAHTYPLSTPALLGSLVAADLNVDGKLDLLYMIIDPFTNLSVSEMLGNGDGSFGSPVVVESGVPGPLTASGVVDLNNDHIPDLAAGGLTVYLGKGDGTFGLSTTYFAGAGPNSFVTGDFNTDGKVDVAVASSAGIGILLGKGDGTFQPATFLTSSVTRLLAASDLNGDGKLDLVGSVNGKLQVLLGNGDGTFTALPATNQTVSQFAQVVDINADGKVDLVTGHGVNVLLGNGDGTFANPLTLVPFGNAGHVGGRGVGAGFVLVQDFNGDKRPDLVFDVFAASAPATSGVVTLLNVVPVVNPDFSISASGLSPATVTAGSSATATITVAPAGTFSGSVTFSCSGLPSGASCSFVPASLPNGSGTSTLTITTMARTLALVMPQGSDKGVKKNYRLTPLMLSLLLASLATVMTVVLLLRQPDKRCGWASLWAMAGLLCLGMTLSSCGGRSTGNNGGTGTRAGTYTVTVSGTSTGSTTLTHSATVTLVVQ